MDDVGSSDTSQSVICFNGEDIPIENFFGSGVFFSGGSNNDGDPSLQPHLEEDEAEMQEEDDNESVQANLHLIRMGPVPLKDQLTARPPTIRGTYDDYEFQNVTPDGGIRKKILQNGTGVTVAPDSKVWFHYVAFAGDDPEAYDSTLARKPISVRLEPPGYVFPGLRLALKSMQVLETAQVVIHHTYAYGEVGCPPRIPSQSILLINIKMIAYVSVDRLSYWQLTPEERSKVPFSKIIKSAKDERAQARYKRQVNQRWPAIRGFRKAINLLEEFTTDNDADNAQRSAMLAALYGNLAETYLELDKPEQTCVACKNGLEFQIKESKPFLLRTFAAAKLKFGSYEAAWNLLKRAEVELGPGAGGNVCEKALQVKLEYEIKVLVNRNPESVDEEFRKKIFAIPDPQFAPKFSPKKR